MGCLLFSTLWLLSLLAETIEGTSGKILRQHLLCSTILSYVAFIPTILSIWIASTRVEDYWHSYSDPWSIQLVSMHRVSAW